MTFAVARLLLKNPRWPALNVENIVRRAARAGLRREESRQDWPHRLRSAMLRVLNSQTHFTLTSSCSSSVSFQGQIGTKDTNPPFHLILASARTRRRTSHRLLAFSSTLPLTGFYLLFTQRFYNLYVYFPRAMRIAAVKFFCEIACLRLA